VQLARLLSPPLVRPSTPRPLCTLAPQPAAVPWRLPPCVPVTRAANQAPSDAQLNVAGKSLQQQPIGRLTAGGPVQVLVGAGEGRDKSDVAVGRLELGLEHGGVGVRGARRSRGAGAARSRKQLRQQRCVIHRLALAAAPFRVKVEPCFRQMLPASSTLQSARAKRSTPSADSDAEEASTKGSPAGGRAEEAAGGAHSSSSSTPHTRNTSCSRGTV